MASTTLIATKGGREEGGGKEEMRVFCFVLILYSLIIWFLSKTVRTICIVRLVFKGSLDHQTTFTTLLEEQLNNRNSVISKTNEIISIMIIIIILNAQFTS